MDYLVIVNKVTAQFILVVMNYHHHLLLQV